MTCPAKAVSTSKRQCTKCGKTIFVCMGCTAREVNFRRPLECKTCQPKPKKPRRR